MEGDYEGGVNGCQRIQSAGWLMAGGLPLHQTCKYETKENEIHNVYNNNIPVLLENILYYTQVYLV